MRFPCNLHTHSLFCDGENTLEEMVLAAIAAGLETIGLSGHSPAEYDSAAMPNRRAAEYLAEGRRLKAKYTGRIEVCVGMEIDTFSPFDRSQLDYCIGSAHYVASDGGQLFSVDHDEAHFRQAIEALGGPRWLVERYCDTVEMLLESIKPDIVGHLDIVTKLNGGNKFFCQSIGWYLEAEERLALAAAKSGCIVEVNTAGFAARREQYPSRRILELLKRQNVPLTLTSDAHSTGRINVDYERAEALLKEIGFTRLTLIKNSGFYQREL